MREKLTEVCVGCVHKMDVFSDMQMKCTSKEVAEKIGVHYRPLRLVTGAIICKGDFKSLKEDS